MTWSEFKEMVDAYLAAEGKGQGVPIFFIDVHLPDRESDRVGVAWDRDLGLVVS